MGKRIGFIGFGSMAQAIAKGLIGAGTCSAGDIYGCAKDYGKLCRNAEAMGVHACFGAAEVIEASQIVVLSVIPAVLEEALFPVLPMLRGKCVVSIVAGWDYERFEKLLLPGTHHISTIPNTPISVGKGILVCEDRHSLSEDEFAEFKALFSTVALLETVTAKQFDAAGTLAGCTPAFTALYIEALADAAVKYGIGRASAYRMASQMLVGTGSLCLESGDHPGALKDAVCSPGGTTIRGISALEKCGFRGAVIEAFDAIEG